MMKGRAEEITTLVIKDNGSLEMAADITAVLCSKACQREKLSVSPGKSLAEISFDVCEIENRGDKSS